MAKTIGQSRARQTEILDLIKNKVIETQEELAAELNKHGWSVTQATVSRDIKELGLIKILDGERYRYAYNGENRDISTKLKNLFRESVISIESANNLIVIKTLSGSANAAAMAIDKMYLEKVLGSIAGDDTVMLIIKTNKDVPSVMKTLKDYMN
jgi:transcriptional regulator of arginine metabolism